MLSTVFYWTLNMSIIGAVTGAFVLALRRIRAIPRQIIYFLWIIPLIRLWIPIAFSNKYSLMTLLAGLGARTIAVSGSEGEPSLTTMNSVQAAESYNPIVYGNNTLRLIFAVGSAVWAVIFAVLLITMLIMYHRAKAQAGDSVHLYKNIYESNQITSPAVYGVFRPKIMVPGGMTSQDLSYAVLHETAHITRGDNFFRLTAIFTACFHWFNPMVWIFLRYCLADMELACDEKVMAKLDEKERKLYAASLLNCLAPTGKLLFSSPFGGAKIKIRIENILSYTKLTAAACVCFVLLLAAIAVALLTNA